MIDITLWIVRELVHPKSKSCSCQLVFSSFIHQHWILIHDGEKQMKGNCDYCSYVSRRIWCVRWLIRLSRSIGRLQLVTLILRVRRLGHVQIVSDAVIAVQHELGINSLLDCLKAAERLRSVDSFLSRNTLFIAFLKCPFKRTSFRPAFLEWPGDVRPSMVGSKNYITGRKLVLSEMSNIFGNRSFLGKLGYLRRNRTPLQQHCDEPSKRNWLDQKRWQWHSKCIVGYVEIP